MNKVLLNHTFLVIFFAGFLAQGFAQENSESNIRLVDEFGKQTSCERLQQSLDNLAIHVQNNSNSKGYIVIHRSHNFIEKFVLRRIALNHFRFRNQDLNRFEIINGKPQQETLVRFWLGIDGARPDIDRREFASNIPDSLLPILASTHLINLDWVDGEYLYLDCDCCLNSAGIGLLRELLDTNPGLRLRILMFGESRRNSEKLIRPIMKELEKADILPGDYTVETRIFAKDEKCFDDSPGECSKKFVVKVWLVNKTDM